MNRLANAFSTALPSADIASIRDSPRPSSPFEPPSRQSERRWDSPAELYDDPRSPYDQPSASSSRNVSQPDRPGFSRRATDEGLGRGLGLLRAGGGHERTGSRSRSRTPRRDRSVRTNLLGQRPKAWASAGVGGAKLTGLAKGPDGRYAVGGGQSLKIIQLNLDHRRDAAAQGTVIGRGDGGASVSEVVNLWRPSWGPQKGVTDLDWGSAAFANKIVTASPSGNWLMFDLERGKMEKEAIGGHPRPLNTIKLCPLPAHGHLLLTGGVEGQVKVWDLRERDPGVRKYFKHSVPVTSICFSPTEATHFLVGLEQGVIIRYDMRNYGKAIGRAYGAHGNKAVLDLKWKAEDGESWLASSGADRTIQVWDMTQGWHEPPSPMHSIHTANPIRRLAWRPGHTTEIAAAPMSQYLDLPGSDVDGGGATRPSDALPTADTDGYVRIWDVRRHDIAKYALPTPDGGAIDLVWEDDGALVACFQDGAFLVQDMQNHVLPIDVIRRQVVGWNIRGEIAYAVDKFKQGEVPFDDVKQEHVGAWRKLGRKEKSIRDTAYVPLQNIGTLPMHTFDEEEWIYLAVHYRMKGDAPQKICRWNAEIAEMCGRLDDARLWIFLQHLIEEFAPSAEEQEFNEGIFSTEAGAQERLETPPDISPNMSPGFEPTQRTKVARRDLRTPSPVPLEPLASNIPRPQPQQASDSDSETDNDETPNIWTSRRGSKGFIAFHPPDERRISDAQSRFSGSRRGSLAPPTITMQEPLETVQSSSSSISGDYPDPYGVDAALKKMQQSITTVPPRVVDARMSISTVRGPQDRGSSGSDPFSRVRKDTRNSSLSSAGNELLSPRVRAADVKGTSTPNGLRALVASPVEEEPERSIEVMKGRQGRYAPAEWDKYRHARCLPLRQWWNAVVDDGDIQLSTCIAVVGSVVMSFPEKQVERVAHAYVDMLERHRLPMAAAVVRLHAGIPSLETLGTDGGVTHLVHCDRCGKSTGGLDPEELQGKKVWWCRRCRKKARVCVICREGVQGLFFGCGKCKHGGHQRCMRMYYQQAPMASIPSHPAIGTKRDVSEETDDGRDGARIYRQGQECGAGCGCMCRSMEVTAEVQA